MKSLVFLTSFFEKRGIIKIIKTKRMKLDVISKKKLDLKDFGYEGYLIFNALQPREASEYQTEFEELQNEENNDQKALEKIDKIIRSKFVEGEIQKDGKNETVDELGDLDISVLYKAFELISGSEEFEKKMKSTDT